MKYLGTKFIGSDSSIFVIDTEKKSVFAVSTERVTRKKHDPFDISPIFRVCKELQNDDYIVSIPFNNFKNVDFSLPTKRGITMDGKITMSLSGNSGFK